VVNGPEPPKATVMTGQSDRHLRVEPVPGRVGLAVRGFCSSLAGPRADQRHDRLATNRTCLVLAVVLGTMEMGGLCSGTAPQLRDVHARSGSGAVKEGRASCGVGTQERPKSECACMRFETPASGVPGAVRSEMMKPLTAVCYAMHGKHAGLSAGPVSR
jgi:hypothetical protein